MIKPARLGGIVVAVSLAAAGCVDSGGNTMNRSAPAGTSTGNAATAQSAPPGGVYERPGDFKFPPIRGDESLVRGPLSVDEILDLGPAGRGPFWHPPSGDVVVSRGGGLWRVDPAGGQPRQIEVTLGDSGFFLTPQNPAYSPDGAWLSWISSRSGTPEIWLRSEATGEARALTDLGFEEINAYSWSPDGDAIAFSASRFGSFDIWTATVPEGQVRRLTSDRLYEVYPSWTPDGDVVYVRLDERWVDHDVMRVGPDGTGARLIARDTDFFDYGYGRTFGFPLVRPDGEAVAFRSHRSGWINYWVAPSDGDGSAADPVPLAAQEADQSDGSWSPDGRWFAFTSNHNGTHDLRVVRADGSDLRVLVAPEMGIVAAPRWSPGGDRISFTLETPTGPASVEVVEVEGGEVRTLLAPELADRTRAFLVEPEKIFYPSTDGLEIPAYLYVPPGAPADAGLPGILWIHGGPTSQWHDSFHAQVQFFVQEGFVVLMPNIRGSSGYGKPFEQLNEQCWGHCDLEDVVAGVDYLHTLPFVNPRRTGIYGSSYGGIMSMAAAAFAPGVFQAAIPHGGYGDWIDFYHGDNELRHIKLLEHDLGPFDQYEDVWRRSSSIYSVADITTPMMLVHGEGRYPQYRQTYDFARALQAHQKTFRYNTYPDENYYVSSRAGSRQLWLDMLRFTDQYLRDGIIDPPTSGATPFP